jgi:hypothetical protein
MTKALDPMWVYGEPVQLPNRQVLTCNLCGKRIFAGISRLKYHLSKIPGFDVDACPNSTPKIMHIANQSLIDMANKRDATEARKKELERATANRYTGTSASEGGPVPQSHSSATGPSTSAVPSSTSSYFVLRSTPGGQPSIRSLIKRKETKEVDKLVAKCFLWSGILLTLPITPSTIPCLKLLPGV